MRKREKNGTNMAIVVIGVASKEGEKVRDQLIAKNKWEI